MQLIIILILELLLFLIKTPRPPGKGGLKENNKPPEPPFGVETMSNMIESYVGGVFNIDLDRFEWFLKSANKK